ncbi:MAG TPA: hypothetical protein PKD15_01010 [Candidatus Saccharibacteria bacterium]|nr:hypothetical protein [Candidatus Saccharibacteria bacterium]
MGFGKSATSKLSKAGNKPSTLRINSTEIKTSRKNWLAAGLVGVLAANGFVASEAGRDTGRVVAVGAGATMDFFVGAYNFLAGAKEGAEDQAGSITVNMPDVPELGDLIESTPDASEQPASIVLAAEGWGTFLVRAYGLSENEAYNCIAEKGLEAITIYAGEDVANPCD